MHPFIAKHLIYHPIQLMRNQRVSDYIQQVRPLQYLSKKELENHADKKIREIVRYAWQNIPYYRKRFRSSDIHPDKINGKEDLVKFPVLSKLDILKNEKALIHPDNLRSYTRKTGGSTGMTLHFKKESHALALNDAIMYRCYEWYGIDIGDKQARFWGVPVALKPRLKETIKDFLLNRIRLSAFEVSPRYCLEQYKRIKWFKPSYFYGYTTAIYGFAHHIKSMGMDLNELKLKGVICTAEKMYPHHRKLFDEVFDCPVIDEYGSSENGIIAFQCPRGKMHLMSDHMCVEFLTDNGAPAKPGEAGKIVITDFSSKVMPLIRYEIGDIGKPSKESCSCGVALPLMEMVEGRKEDFIRLKSGQWVHAAYLCYTLKEDAVSEFKMYQKAPDYLLVQIVKSPSFNRQTENVLRKRLLTNLGEGIKIQFEYLERIPREKSGKLRYFVSQI